MRVLGVDPGLGITGYAVVELIHRDPRLIEAGAIRSGERRTLAERLQTIHADLREVIAEHAPDLLAVEALYSEYRFPRTAIQMGHARGVICLAAAQCGLTVIDIAATTVKSSLLGSGHASKWQVQATVQSIYGLPEPPSPPDVADAIAIATAAAYRQARSLAAAR